jgi:hypothetical protein
MRSPVPVLVLVLVLACGGSVFPVPTDGGATDAADGAVDAPSDTLTCTYGAPTTLAAEKPCLNSNECTYLSIPISCCQETAYGVNANFKAAIAAEVAARTTGCPGCGCAAQPQDELGKPGTSFQATCDQGKCTAHAK